MASIISVFVPSVTLLNTPSPFTRPSHASALRSSKPHLKCVSVKRDDANSPVEAALRSCHNSSCRTSARGRAGLVASAASEFFPGLSPEHLRSSKSLEVGHSVELMSFSHVCGRCTDQFGLSKRRLRFLQLSELHHKLRQHLDGLCFRCCALIHRGRSTPTTEHLLAETTYRTHKRTST